MIAEATAEVDRLECKLIAIERECRPRTRIAGAVVDVKRFIRFDALLNEVQRLGQLFAARVFLHLAEAFPGRRERCVGASAYCYELPAKP